jgi:hypothetical protein
LEALVVALGADGQYRGARSLGGTGADLASGVAVLPDGDLLLSGSFEGRVDFGVGREVDARSAAGFSDAFLTRFRFSDERRAANPQNPSPAACDFRSEALPTSYEQCLAAGGQAIVGPSEATCLRSWCQPSSEFDTCRALGGGLSSADGVQQQPCCKIVYRQGGCPCLGNACD